MSWTNIYAIVAILFSLSTNSFSQKLKIDHVIILVDDLKKAINEYQVRGFTIKGGHLHENGLNNAFIKFSNNSYVELMAIEGKPSDPLSEKYYKLLQDGTKGAYLALSGVSITSLQKRLTNLKIKYKTSTGNPWTYIFFYPNSGLEHVFFIENNSLRSEDSNIYNHENSSVRIDTVWIEGGLLLVNLLKDIGLTEVRTAALNEQNFSTPTGIITVIPVADKYKRPEIRAVSFESEESLKGTKVSY